MYFGSSRRLAFSRAKPAKKSGHLAVSMASRSLNKADNCGASFNLQQVQTLQQSTLLEAFVMPRRPFSSLLQNKRYFTFVLNASPILIHVRRFVLGSLSPSSFVFLLHVELGWQSSLLDYVLVLHLA